MVLVVTFETVNSLPFKLLLPKALSVARKLPAILTLLLAVIPVVLARVNVKVFSAALNSALCPFPLSAAAICSDDGRHLAIMPHLERSIFPWNWAHYPSGRNDKISPWILPFYNARMWLEENA